MNVGIALSGGGARGFAHLGVLLALEEKNFKPCIITGTSAGAVAGAFYAAGYRPEEILKIILETRFFKAFRPGLNRRGLIKMDVLENLYRSHFPGNSFEQLKTKLIITATDLHKGRTVFFSSGELIRPMMASTCIPVLFDPISVGESVYVDGGLLNNLPVEPLVGHCEYIVGVNANPYNTKSHIGSIRKVVEKSFQLAINYNVRDRMRLCNCFLEPPELDQYSIMDLKHAYKIFEIGYNYAIKQDFTL
jgi:NTE family protein